MYLQHFGLKEFPFGITPDTDYFFASDGSQQALNTLLIAARTGEGFIKITGEVGTGKTLLCRKLLGALEPEFKVAYIPNPYLEPQELFKELISELSERDDFKPPDGESLLLRTIGELLVKIHHSGRRAIVCMDEVQAMPIETLEALRLITNLETEKKKLLQVVIFGQPELEEKLAHPSIRQLKQRIAFEYHLTPMKNREINYYVHHRLAVAGYSGPMLFTEQALWLLKLRTRCVPRLVNIICHKAMLCAYGRGDRRVTFSDVAASIKDTASISDTGIGWWFKAVLAGTVVVAIGVWAGMAAVANGLRIL